MSHAYEASMNQDSSLSCCSLWATSSATATAVISRDDHDTTPPQEILVEVQTASGANCWPFYIGLVIPPPSAK
jgi:hypothetical protein